MCSVMGLLELLSKTMMNYYQIDKKEYSPNLYCTYSNIPQSLGHSPKIFFKHTRLKMPNTTRANVNMPHLYHCKRPPVINLPLSWWSVFLICVAYPSALPTIYWSPRSRNKTFHTNASSLGLFNATHLCKSSHLHHVSYGLNILPIPII